MAKTFFTSDLHFFHNNIIKYCKRPYGSVEHMNTELVKNWNSVVVEEDHVWHLGDFSFGNVEQTESILQQLKGIKHFIIGNHDRKGRAENVKWDKWGYIEGDYRRLKVNGYKFVLCHFPFHSWERGYINLHGHTHGTYASRFMQHDVGADVNNYTPLLLEYAVKRAIEGKNETLY